MVTVTCQHTGVQFEARTKATKNHPQVAAALDRVVKSWGGRNAYGLLMDALQQLRDTGGQPTLDEFDDLANAAIEAGRTDRSDWLADWKRQRVERKQHHAAVECEENPNAVLMAEVDGRSDADSDSRYDEV